LVVALLSGTATVLGPVRPAPTPAYVVLPARSAAWAGSGVPRRGPPSRVLA
ncbi:MAG: hypothetical protein HOQ45_21280, partial [Nocardioidaceae bacterium]|nr:hypothetical protein [Nocardioidaceae bacterium]